ncbi:putative disease resistance RPP13-like protein 2 [Dichanthelium oligosanthes]|uniref:Putative disease resistance RPP13-like protein 2 n=1 Tax=Dichanthelium oligosanthes TaxID=888268 RepID=A0A1E5V1F0_9POAL|nr:putative disease resistance RPP13-like protein 2 [Dichanthelium oligosanthes]
MDLVVGGSESTVKSVLGKLGSLLAQEYSLIRGVGRDLQYITDELRTMQSFLVDLRDAKQDCRMKDWAKQIREMTYDVEDCVDDSGHRIHNPRWLRSDMCCYFLLNSVYEVRTWWPRRDVASKISDLKMRAQQISERRQRYGVDNPQSSQRSTEAEAGANIRFNAAENQDRSLNLVAMKDPVGVHTDMEDLEKWMQNKTNKNGVLAIVGFGGVGKTIIAAELYRKFVDQFDCRAMVTVSQGSDLEAILTSIKDQVMPQSDEQKPLPEKRSLGAALRGVVCRCSGSATTDNSNERVKSEVDSGLQEQHDMSELDSDDEEQQGALPGKKSLTAVVRDMLGQVRRHKSAVMAKSSVSGTSNKTQDNAKLIQLKEELSNLLTEKSNIIRLLPQSKKDRRIIVTTRFQAVATTCTRDESIKNVKALGREESDNLFKQVVSESKGNIDQVPDEVWNICGGLPLALVIMAGYVGCNPSKSPVKLLQDYESLFPESTKDRREGLKQEEAGRIISHCYNDMPAEIKTCSLYLSIFPKGNRISRKRLTRRWIAEGFVSEKEGMSMEDVADTYFSHLIKRKIIRPMEHSSNGKVKNCVVHDMILEHIVAKASDENFIAVVGGHWLMQQPSSKVRRLSLQGGDSKGAKDTESMNLSHVRSLTMFGSLNQLPLNSFKFKIVQVLDLEGCTDFRQRHTNEICKMIFLKYLSLRRTTIKKLPKAIKKLEKLETLDIRETDVAELPNTICNLARLVNILGGNKRKGKALRLPKDLTVGKKMVALRILSGIEIVDASADLHHLTELRKLSIYRLGIKKRREAFKELLSSIAYLGGFSLHTLIVCDDSSRFLQSLEDLANPPNSFIALELSGKMVRFPSWITKLDVLNKLTLPMTLLKEENLSRLSKLKALFSLTFTSSAAQQDQETVTIIEGNRSGPNGEIIVPAGGFLTLKLLRITAPRVPLLCFSKTAMPCLERLELNFSMSEGLLGRDNLVCLKEVHLRLQMKKKNEDENAIQIKDIEGFSSKKDLNPKIIFDQCYD